MRNRHTLKAGHAIRHILAEEAIHAALWDYAEKHDIQIEGLEKPASDISEHHEA